MRFAVFSDVHGNLLALDACLADLESQGAPTALSLRAISVSTDRNPRRCCCAWKRSAPRCIRGNKDRYVFDEAVAETLTAAEKAQIAWTRREIGERWLAWLRELPFALRMGEDDNQLLIVHAKSKERRRTPLAGCR